MQHKTTLILRLTAAALFLWFGVMQLADPGVWIGYLPEWLGYVPVTPETFVRLNGWFEVVLALLLAAGAYTRVAAILLGLHLLGIAAEAGGAIGARDAALAVFTLAIVSAPLDPYALDTRLMKGAEVAEA